MPAHSAVLASIIPGEGPSQCLAAPQPARTLTWLNNEHGNDSLFYRAVAPRVNPRSGVNPVIPGGGGDRDKG